MYLQQKIVDNNKVARGPLAPRGNGTLPELNPVSGPRGFPTELTPRGKPCCIVRIFEECSMCGICRTGGIVVH